MVSSGGSSFPVVDVDKELNPGKHKSFQADPTSAEITASLEIKDQIEKAKQRREKEKKDVVQKLKSAIIISGIVAAVAGAVFAISKKLKEK